MKERRESPRHAASLPAQIITDAGRATIAITCDVSATGLLALSRRVMAVGETVEISVLFNETQHVFTATVIRQDPLASGENTLWQYKVALAIDRQNPVLAKILAALEAA